MTGPPRKPADRRQRRNREQEVAVLTGNVLVDPPEAPAAWLVPTKRAWQSYWQSPVAGMLDEADVPALLRLFSYRDEHERFSRAFVKNPFVPGSKGQPVLSPLAGLILNLERAIVALEDRYGLSPASRMKLNISVGEAKKSLESLNESVFVADDDTDDPRLAAVVDITPGDAGEEPVS